MGEAALCRRATHSDSELESLKGGFSREKWVSSSLFAAILGPVSGTQRHSFYVVSVGRRRVSAGHTAPINSAWVPEGAKFRSPLTSFQDPDLKISQFIIPGTNCWDAQALAESFAAADVSCILSIPLPFASSPDSLSWWPDKSGTYSVRSAYWLGSCDQVASWEERLSGNNIDIWRLIWKLKVPWKVRNFAWRCCAEALPLRLSLFQRHIISEATCPACLNQDESVWHMAVSCPEVAVVWAGSPIESWTRQHQFVDIISAVMDLYAIHGVAGVKDFFIKVWICWSIRNKRVFEPDFQNYDVIRMGLLQFVTDFDKGRCKRSSCPSQLHSKSSAIWVRPPEHILKINVDAFVNGSSIELGVIIRDWCGKPLLLGSKSIPCCGGVTLAESLACKWGLQLAWHFGYVDVLLESDCQDLIKAIQ